MIEVAEDGSNDVDDPRADNREQLSNWAWRWLLFSFAPRPVFPRFLPPFYQAFYLPNPLFSSKPLFSSPFLFVQPPFYVSIILLMSGGCFCWCLMMLGMRRVINGPLASAAFGKLCIFSELLSEMSWIDENITWIIMNIILTIWVGRYNVS